MNKEFIPYQQALALKELGFDEPCFKVYDTMGYLQDEQTMLNMELDYCPAPTFSQAFRWFREKYYLHSYIKCSCSVNEIFSFDWIIHKIMNAGTKEENFLTDYERTYEEAELECLIKLIQIVNEKSI